MNWFQAITGFPEGTYEATQGRLRVVMGQLASDASARSFRVGSLETPTLGDLRARTAHLADAGRTRVSILQGDARMLHAHPEGAGALFQVASQFNLLEMVHPDVSPEDGVARYELDRTQGPACAIAAGAGTIFRNYLVRFPDGTIGQTRERQIDCLRDLGAALGDADGHPWRMQNGYALFTAEGLSSVDRQLAGADAGRLDELRGLLRIGLHWDVGLTDVEPGPTVSQAFCSALPVSYNRIAATDLWARFATLVLEAAYEATLQAGRLATARGGSNRVFLTRLGGGAFGNQAAWIDQAMRRALELARAWGLDVRVVSYGPPDHDLQRLVREFGEPT
ncbi:MULTISPECIES: hypothetical protein [Ramlibacter]|uniref:Macro domain-containing protein n=1 Tax=Ramlibacter pinisoli TaxID=2682844 RepID=A0A6N8IVI0_9BURK|nr:MULTISPECIES: hypothetical protein [Ramlibacter]MBA2961009.1 hypothetical protein [Ramlibacter sp. CGMCC 1.13660]MVQ30954.1 hypothetical protein [Ramlibacter pinisoli]